MRRWLLTLALVSMLTCGWSTLSNAVPSIRIVLGADSVDAGGIVHAEVRLGSTAAPVVDLLGIGFRIQYDRPALLMAYLEPGELLSGDNSIFYARVDLSAGLGSYSTSTITGVGINGSGTVALFDVYVDASAVAGAYVIRPLDVQAINSKGLSIPFQAVPDTLVVRTNVSAVGPAREVPAMRVTRPFPNPLRDRTQVALSLPEARRIHAVVFDSVGRLVRRLASEELSAGTHSLAWDARRDDGSSVAAGVYFLTINDGIVTRSLPITVVR